MALWSIISSDHYLAVEVVDLFLRVCFVSTVTFLYSISKSDQTIGQKIGCSLSVLG